MKRTKPSKQKFERKAASGYRKKGNPNNHSTKHKFDPENTPQQIFNLALLGLTDKEMARCLNIATNTLDNWKQKYDTVRQAYDEGKHFAAAQTAHTLFKKANGFYYEEDIVVKDRQGVPHKITVQKYSHPDTIAGIFLMKNLTRKFEQPWVDGKSMEVSGKNGETLSLQLIEEISVEELQKFSVEELKRIPGLRNKLLALQEGTE